MSHAVESMFAVKETPWHGLGQLLDAAPTLQQGIKRGGLDWEVELRPLYLADKREVTSRAVVRKSDDSILGVVGAAYEPLQNADAFSWFDPFLKNGEAELHTAGSLFNGRKIWVLAEIQKQAMKVGDDLIRKFILLSNSHDGTSSVRVGFTPIRVVCANTLRLAHGDRASKLIRVIHNTNVKTNLELLRQAMNAANEEFEMTAAEFRKLVKRKVNEKDLRKYARLVLDVAPEEKDEKLAGITRNTIDLLVELAKNGKGNSGKTMWDAYNGVTEWLSYNRGKSQDTRLDSLWFGESARINQRALEVALKMTAV